MFSFSWFSCVHYSLSSVTTLLTLYIKPKNISGIVKRHTENVANLKTQDERLIKRYSTYTWLCMQCNKNTYQSQAANTVIAQRKKCRFCITLLYRTYLITNAHLGYYSFGFSVEALLFVKCFIFLVDNFRDGNENRFQITMFVSVVAWPKSA